MWIMAHWKIQGCSHRPSLPSKREARGLTINLSIFLWLWTKRKMVRKSHKLLPIKSRTRRKWGIKNWRGIKTNKKASTRNKPNKWRPRKSRGWWKSILISNSQRVGSMARKLNLQPISREILSTSMLMKIIRNHFKNNFHPLQLTLASITKKSHKYSKITIYK